MGKKAKTKTGKHPGGRPTKYREEYCDLAYKACLLGATDEKLAGFFEVDEATINRWKDAHPEFCESLKNGKERADAEVAEALFHRAKGYSHPDVHISSYEGGITITDITKHYPPDTAAAFIWLKNRAGWRDKQELAIAPETLADIAAVMRGGHTDGGE